MDTLFETLIQQKETLRRQQLEINFVKQQIVQNGNQNIVGK